MRASLAAGLGLLLLASGCVMEGNTEDRCSDWTRDVDESGFEVHFHVRNERPDPVCVQAKLAGDAVAKVPLGPVEGGERSPEDERTIPSSQPRLTVRVDLWNEEAWATEAVDLEQTPHVLVTVQEGGLGLEALEQAPDPRP